MLIPIGDETPTRTTPWVNYALIAANCGVFMYALYHGLSEEWILKFGHRAAHHGGWTLLTSMFLHAGLLHLAGNMWFLWITGDNVEDRLGHLGYLTFYLLSGVGASLVQDRFMQGSLQQIPAVGASGAIAAVMGAYLCLIPKGRIRLGCFLWLFPPIMLFSFTLPAFVTIGFWFWEQSQAHLFQVVHGVTSPVGYAAHCAGFLFGAIAVMLLALMGQVRCDWMSRRRGSD